MKTETSRSAKTRPGWTVVVFYEDSESRKAAVRFCDRLVERFWSEREFDIHWTSFASLADNSGAECTADKATYADVIVFAAKPDGALPDDTVAWIENCLCNRNEHEGALVGLLHTDSEFCGDPAGSNKHVYLRNVAHRLCMDYWTQIPQDLSRIIPDSIESYSARADRVTHVLDEILHQNVLQRGMTR